MGTAFISRGLRYLVTRLGHDRRGAISVVAALSLPFVIGIVGLAIEYGNALVTKADNQRTADAAAFSAGLAYTAARTAGAADPASAAAAAAVRIAVLNGVAASAVATTTLVSPRGTGNQAVQVTVTTGAPLMFARMLGTGSTLTVPAAATAELTGGAQGCLYALAASPGTGITTAGGATITAASCVAASNNTISVPCGTTMTVAAATYNSASAPSQPCGGLRGAGGGAAPLSAKALTDPLVGNTAVAAAAARIATVAALTSPAAPAAPVVSGTNGIDFGYTASTQTQAVALGCTATLATATWTLTCPAGNRTFATFTLQGGIRVNFVPAGLASNVYSFKSAVNTGSSGAGGVAFGPGTYRFASDFQTSGAGNNSFASGNITIGGTLINQSSGALTFGAGTFNIRGGIYNQGTSLTFGAGTFNVGAASGAYGCSGNYSLCDVSGTVVFGGPSLFNFTAGINANPGASITLGAGTGNSYRIGPSLYNYAIVNGAGASTVFAAATASDSVFEANGGITGGGSGCLALPAAAQHDIDGSIDVAGGLVLGAGVYTVNGFVAFGQAGGGAGICGGTYVSVQAAGVTLVVSGATRATSGACAGQSFCVAAGYSNLVLTAPTAGDTANIVLIGPQGTAATAQNLSGALFADGSANANIAGTFYYPRGPIALGGGAGIGNQAGQCLTLIGSQITLTGGAVIAATCPGTGGTGSGGSVALIR